MRVLMSGLPLGHLAFACLLLGSGAQAAESVRPLIRDFIGLNGHTIQFKPELYAPVARLARDYHPLEWDLGGDPATPTAFPFAHNQVDWSTVYGSWRKAGIDVHTSLMFETLKPAQWTDAERNATAYGLAYAQAFGPGARTPLVSSVEIGNEPGAFDAELYRTIFLGMSRGLRQGDPKLKIGTCNVTAGTSTRYARSIEEFRGLDRAFDLFSLHVYAEAEGWPTWRRSYPEDPGITFLKEIREVCTWRDRNAPGKPIWITEFGWDAATTKPDVNGPFARWQGVTDEQQAAWLVRSVLLFASLPIERAYIYFFNDDDVPSVHSSSGITRKWQPKPSYHALAHLQRTLGDYRFAGIVRQDAGLMLFRFRHATDPKKLVLVGWSPTGDDRVVKMRLPVQPGMRLTSLQYMPLTAIADAVPLPPVVDGQIEVTIREAPLFGWVQAP